jgi:hypothetical protein
VVVIADLHVLTTQCTFLTPSPPGAILGARLVPLINIAMLGGPTRPQRPLKPVYGGGCRRTQEGVHCKAVGIGRPSRVFF